MTLPITLGQAKMHLRVYDDSNEDVLISDLIATAAERVENICGFVIEQRTETFSFDRFTTSLLINRRNVSGTPTLAYIGSDGVATAYTDFRAYKSFGWTFLAPVSTWPTINASPGLITVTAVIGGGTVPQGVERAMYLMIADWFENREGASEFSAHTEKAIAALLNHYRAGLA